MSLERSLRESLDRPLDGEREAAERAWRVVEATTPADAPARRRPGSRRQLVAVATALVAAALAATPPGDAVSSWIRDELGVDGDTAEAPSRPALRALPGGGEVLASSRPGAWVVGRDGSRRRIGAYRDASWSPNGLFVAAARGRQLAAVTPDGEIRWALTAARRVRAPRWAPSGLRIAYFSGGTLRAVSGDGAGDVELVRGAAHTPPAWRPTATDELALADRRGRVALVSVVTGRRIWRSAPGPRSRSLTWSPDGRRLAAVGNATVRVLDARGRSIARRRPTRGARFAAAAYAPRGRRLALIEQRPGGAAVRLAGSGAAGSPIFATAAPLEDLAWSPDGRWLLVTSPMADQWLFLRSRRPHRVVAFSAVAAQLDPAGDHPWFPRLLGWCCPSGR